MKHSCGAILYAWKDDVLGIILGLEDGKWFVFKGCCESGETYENAAIREVFEESCGLIKINKLHMMHNFKTKHKHYHIGIHKVKYDIINIFPIVRAKEQRKEFIEKKRLIFIPLSDINNTPNIHRITMLTIKYYWKFLINEDRNRKHQRQQRQRQQQRQHHIINKEFHEPSGAKYKKRTRRYYKLRKIRELYMKTQKEKAQKQQAQYIKTD